MSGPRPARYSNMSVDDLLKKAAALEADANASVHYYDPASRHALKQMALGYLEEAMELEHAESQPSRNETTS